MPPLSSPLTDIARVIVTVSDQDRALLFYTQTLGFEVASDTPYGDGERWLEVVPPGAHTAIALAAPMGVPAGGAMIGISFATADVGALHGELRDRGVDVDAEVTREPPPVPPMFFFRDQDGNTLHVAEQS